MLLIGGAPGWLGRSAWLATVCRPRRGRAAAGRSRRRAAQRRVRRCRSFAGGASSAVHDLSDGGLAVALAEMAMAGGIGATIDEERRRRPRARLLLRRGSGPLCRDGAPRGRRRAPRARRAALASRRRGWARPAADDLDLARRGADRDRGARTAFEFWLPAYMDGPRGRTDMTNFVAVKALAGFNYFRADQVVASPRPTRPSAPSTWPAA